MTSEATTKRRMTNRCKHATQPTAVDAALNDIKTLVVSLNDLHRQMALAYTPIVQGIIQSGSQDVHEIEHTLDHLCFAERSFITKEKDAALRKGKLKRHDVVLTTRGTVGNVALFDDSVHFDHVRINSGMVLLRADQSKLLPRYLYQFVRSLVFKDQAAALTTGSAQPQLPIRDIRRVEIPLPPIAEQKAIAAVLGALDDKIELNRRMNATLEAMARALFQSWFGFRNPGLMRIPPEVATLGFGLRSVGTTNNVARSAA